MSNGYRSCVYRGGKFPLGAGNAVAKGYDKCHHPVSDPTINSLLPQQNFYRLTAGAKPVEPGSELVSGHLARPFQCQRFCHPVEQPSTPPRQQRLLAYRLQQLHQSTQPQRKSQQQQHQRQQQHLVKLPLTDRHATDTKEASPEQRHIQQQQRQPPRVAETETGQLLRQRRHQRNQWSAEHIQALVDTSDSFICSSDIQDHFPVTSPSYTATDTTEIDRGIHFSQLPLPILRGKSQSQAQRSPGRDRLKPQHPDPSQQQQRHGQGGVIGRPKVASSQLISPVQLPRHQLKEEEKVGQDQPGQQTPQQRHPSHSNHRQQLQQEHHHHRQQRHPSHSNHRQQLQQEHHHHIQQLQQEHHHHLQQQQQQPDKGAARRRQTSPQTSLGQQTKQQQHQLPQTGKSKPATSGQPDAQTDQKTMEELAVTHTVISSLDDTHRSIRISYPDQLLRAHPQLNNFAPWMAHIPRHAQKEYQKGLERKMRLARAPETGHLPAFIVKEELRQQAREDAALAFSSTRLHVLRHRPTYYLEPVGISSTVGKGSSRRWRSKSLLSESSAAGPPDSTDQYSYSKARFDPFHSSCGWNCRQCFFSSGAHLPPHRHLSHKNPQALLAEAQRKTVQTSKRKSAHAFPHVKRQ